ncbi:MAG: flagellar type III secretion system protein FliR, partial [Firmicutes bacterium]|nr:flagellar type III secretion system protein FliR [Bacillota bacterium]
LLFFLASIVFLSTDGHHWLLHALWTSWRLVPPGAQWGGPGLFEQIVRAATTMFVAGFQIAAPVVAALLLADLALGIVARTMPQLNIFVVGLPLKSFLGIGMVLLSLSAYGVLLRVLLREVQAGLEGILYLLPPR